MSLIDRIERLAPALVARYYRNRLAVEGYRRAYEAAQVSHQHRTRPISGTGDHSLHRAGGRLRDVARDLEENSDRAGAVLETLVNFTVGTGIRVEPQVRARGGELHEAMNNQIRSLRAQWARAPEATGELPLAETERLTARTWFRDGEILIRHIAGAGAGYRYGTPVPYVVELIECDQLPFDLNDPDRRVRHGVRKDEWGRPVAYHLLRAPPLDAWPAYAPAPSLRDTLDIPAAEMTHLKIVRRVRQTRGVSILHAVFRRLDDLKEYEDSERIAARVASAMCAVITKSRDVARPIGADDHIDAAGGQGSRAFDFLPGMVFDNLLPGEGVDIIKADRPSTGLEQYASVQMKAVAGGTGAVYSTIARDYRGTFQSQRQEMNEGRMSYQRLSELFIGKVSTEIHRRMVEASIASGQLRVPVASVDVSTLTDAVYQAPGMDWVDPRREAEGARIEYELGLVSRAALIRRKGGDPEKVFAEREAEDRRFGVSRETEPGATRAAGGLRGVA